MLSIGYLICLALLISLVFEVDFKKTTFPDVVIFAILWVIALMSAGYGCISNIP